jgi:enoyl-[acyl-carrier protein] reductase II
LRMKKLVPVRLLKNTFADAIAAAEAEGASTELLQQMLGRARAKAGMFEGDLEEGELEIGQVAAMIREIKPAAEILQQIWREFLIERESLKSI